MAPPKKFKCLRGHPFNYFNTYIVQEASSNVAGASPSGSSNTWQLERNKMSVSQQRLEDIARMVVSFRSKDLTNAVNELLLEIGSLTTQVTDLMRQLGEKTAELKILQGVLLDTQILFGQARMESDTLATECARMTQKFMDERKQVVSMAEKLAKMKEELGL